MQSSWHGANTRTNKSSSEKISSRQGIALTYKCIPFPRSPKIGRPGDYNPELIIPSVQFKLVIRQIRRWPVNPSLEKGEWPRPKYGDEIRMGSSVKARGSAPNFTVWCKKHKIEIALKETTIQLAIDTCVQYQKDLQKHDLEERKKRFQKSWVTMRAMVIKVLFVELKRSATHHNSSERNLTIKGKLMRNSKKACHMIQLATHPLWHRVVEVY